MRKLNSKGFSTLEIILVLIVVGLSAGAGVYFFKQQKKDDTQPANTTSQTQTDTKPAETKATPDPTADWVSYTSAEGKFSLKYPKTWVTATNPELCSPGILLLGANSGSVGKCASEGFGQISVTGQPSHADCGDLNAEAWTVNSKETVTVASVTGLKQAATAKAPADGAGTDPEGTKILNYCFNNNGYTYVANYKQLPSYPDALADFSLMVTKTLKFN
jgi:hypothetical protein